MLTNEKRISLEPKLRGKMRKEKKVTGDKKKETDDKRK
jgi:hypothetical protein